MDNFKPLSHHATLFLKYLYDHRGKGDLNSKDIFTELGIEKRLWSRIVGELWERMPHRFIEGQSGIYGVVPKIRINQSGIDYINEFFPDMSTINETCEFLFKEHQRKGSILWAKSANPDFPGNSGEARKLMVRQRVIYEDPDMNTKVTRLEPEVMQATSYNEALKILEDKRKPIPPSVGIYAPHNKGSIAHSSTSGDDSPITQSVNTTPSIKNSAPKKSWYKRPLFVYLIFPIAAALLTALIIYIIQHLHWK